MPNLTPVDNDPFADTSSASAPVQFGSDNETNQSENQHGASPSLTPVDHDPFADTNQPAQDNTSFIENPSWGKLGRAASAALKDANQEMIDPIARTGAIIRGKTPMTMSDIPLMAMPFITGPKSTEAAGDALASAPAAAAEAAASPVRAVKTLANGYNASTPQELQTEAQTLRASANPYYTQMRNIGATYTPDSIDELTTNLGNTLAKMDVIPKLSPVSNDVVQQINDQAKTGDLSLNHLDQYRRQLGDASGSDSAVAAALRKTIDSHVNNTTADDLNNGSPQAVALLNRARAEYTRGANFNDVATILQKANGDPTKIKNSLNNFMSDDSNLAGMTSDEKTSLRRASQTSSGEAMSKMLGKAGFTVIPTNASGNGVMPYMMMAAENGARTGTAFLPHAAPLVAAGTLSKAGNTLYGRGLAENALDTIRNRPMPSADFTPPEPTGGIEDPNDATFETPKALPQQARGGRTKATQKPKTGVVYAKPKSYPALQNRQTP